MLYLETPAGVGFSYADDSAYHGTMDDEATGILASILFKGGLVPSSLKKTDIDLPEKLLRTVLMFQVSFYFLNAWLCRNQLNFC